MKIPEKIKIKTKTHTIEFKNYLIRDDEAGGKYCSSRQKIILDNSQEKEQIDVAFLHELLHAIIDSSSLRVDLDDKDLEEKVVTSISEDLLLIIQENNLDFRK